MTHGETVAETANMISFMADVIGIRDDMFIGEGVAEVFGDYGAGPNHVLPNGGAARFSGEWSWCPGHPQGVGAASRSEARKFRIFESPGFRLSIGASTGLSGTTDFNEGRSSANKTRQIVKMIRI